MRSRKYRDERNSRRNRRWLQDEIDASGHLPGCGPIRQPIAVPEAVRVQGFSVAASAAARKLVPRPIPFKEFAADYPSLSP